MLAQILLMGGFEPTIFIGGRLPLINANGRAGNSDIMVANRASIRTTFIDKPAVSVILNVDADHLDYFKSLENVIESFRKFARTGGKKRSSSTPTTNALRAAKGIPTKK